MKRKLAFALVSAASLVVLPAFAEGEEATTTTTTTATATAAAPAAASGEKEFGNAGVINFAAATRLDIAFTSIKPPQGDSASASHIGIQPSIDYFVADNISVGALLGIDLNSSKAAGASDSDSSTKISVGPRVGYNIWITPGSLSLWPLLGFTFATESSKSGGKDGPTFTTMAVQAFVPLVIHPVKHFHLAVGPFMSLDVSSKAKAAGGGDSVDGNKATTFGLMGEIAGWL